MTGTVTEVDARAQSTNSSHAYLFGLVLAVVTEAIAGTALSVGRSDVMGDIHATPDEFSLLDIGFTTLRLVGFLACSWLAGRFDVRRIAVFTILVIGATSVFAAGASEFSVLMAIRCVQGFMGGVLLVAAQTGLFLAYPASRQPFVQAMFAMAAVVAPGTLAPALQGWIVDEQSWTLIFSMSVPLSILSVGFLLLGSGIGVLRAPAQRADVVGLILAVLTICCGTYVLSVGSRWDWFESDRIWLLTTIASIGLLLLVVRHATKGGSTRLVDLSIFRSTGFSFGFTVSFVAGAALFGSSYLIPSFAVSVLGLTPTDAGLLLLPSAALFIVSMLIAAYLIQMRGMSPVATVPLGILSVMLSMAMLSTSNSQSGPADMMPAILIRGFGLGLLFLPITIIAFVGLKPSQIATGIGLFNFGRQVGGLAGVAALQTSIEHRIVSSATIIGEYVTPGSNLVTEKLTALAGNLSQHGMDSASASRLAMAQLYRQLNGQAAVLAFDSAFLSVALLFVTAAPVIIAIRIMLKRVEDKAQRERDTRGVAPSN